ncbi:PEP/pyruvate-binding domain-containing protein [Methanoplanus endosymbiosus]|uniref:PEP-utilizing enzyme n=1 Tax=Methanoplanus endosymbiosus TaxID=33865 RepID=A0A9E7PM15_9EURY|nr:PEP/pyruvate-binding domain-containing protein [Methanoplanus endosymbiosus]UUX92643.1 PEP-utilizing enzyme [Methanoplanus endosymbiosus]
MVQIYSDKSMIKMQTIYHFNDNIIPELREVGGKALSLIKMTDGGLPVPPGFVLTSSFFQPWVDEIQATEDWKNLLASDSDKQEELSGRLKARCKELKFTDEQNRQITDALNAISHKGLMIFAVRSSSPEEDLEYASFAGVYDSVLGVIPEKLEDAVKTVFSSALDIRAIKYKEQHGFGIDRIIIAVIIQEQIASEVAGVGFSINPLSNCYDEAVINANWGLGESIVSGAATPDQYVIDKFSGDFKTKKTGGKEVSYFLRDDASIETVNVLKNNEMSLSDEEALKLKDLLVKVEEYYKMPMDIEWAFAHNNLYLVQARPITTYVPLPPEIMTKPAEKRRLYLDLTLVEQGISSPLSPMGARWFSDTFDFMMVRRIGHDVGHDIINGLGGSAGGRTYINLSNMLWIHDPEGIAKKIEGLDSYSAEIIRSINPDDYKSSQRPPELRAVKIKGLYHTAGVLGRSLEGMITPEKLKEKYIAGVDAYLNRLKEEDAQELSIEEYYRAVTKDAVDLIQDVTIPTLIDAEIAKQQLRKLFCDEDPDIKYLADRLDRALPDNVTTEMGLEIYDLSVAAKNAGNLAPEKLEESISARKLPEDFLSLWDSFMEKYGFRGPLEIDLKSPRYAEEPLTLINQMQNFAMVSVDAESPKARFLRQQKEREEGYDKLCTHFSDKTDKLHKFKKLYKIVVMFGGFREVHKYYLMMANYRIRQRALDAGRRLAAEGRLDSFEDVFKLTVYDLQKGLDNPDSDLREITEENMAFISRLNQVKAFPPVIDSRGEILRPPKRESKDGELYGDPVSSGVIRGPVNIMRYPGEKPVMPGDILVIHAADPGWTPLFITAGGIILEVGGMLQHGSIIAREYGKPCIAGVEDVLSLFEDGQMVELNGAEGSVRFIKDQ